MLREFVITYNVKLWTTTLQKRVVIEAYSKYNAKKKFYAQCPTCEIVKIEEVE